MTGVELGVVWERDTAHAIESRSAASLQRIMCAGGLQTGGGVKAAIVGEVERMAFAGCVTAACTRCVRGLCALDAYRCDGHVWFADRGSRSICRLFQSTLDTLLPAMLVLIFG